MILPGLEHGITIIMHGRLGEYNYDLSRGIQSQSLSTTYIGLEHKR